MGSPSICLFIGDWSGDWLCVIIGRDVFLRFPGSTLLFAAPRSLWCLGFWARGVHCAFDVLGGLAEGVRCAKCPCSMHSGARVFFGHTALVVFWFGLGCGSRFLCAAAGLLSLVSGFFLSSASIMFLLLSSSMRLSGPGVVSPPFGSFVAGPYRYLFAQVSSLLEAGNQQGTTGYHETGHEKSPVYSIL